jgi:hypothetical protein
MEPVLRRNVALGDRDDAVSDRPSLNQCSTGTSSFAIAT